MSWSQASQVGAAHEDREPEARLAPGPYAWPLITTARNERLTRFDPISDSRPLLLPGGSRPPRMEGRLCRPFGAWR